MVYYVLKSIYSLPKGLGIRQLLFYVFTAHFTLEGDSKLFMGNVVSQIIPDYVFFFKKYIDLDTFQLCTTCYLVQMRHRPDSLN